MVHFRLQLVTESADGRIVATDELACFDRAGLGPATVGLTLEEAKALLATCQKHMILAQVRDYEEAARACPSCARPRSVKGTSGIVLRTYSGRPRCPATDCITAAVIPRKVPVSARLPRFS